MPTGHLQRHWPALPIRLEREAAGQRHFNDIDRTYICPIGKAEADRVPKSHRGEQGNAFNIVRIPDSALCGAGKIAEQLPQFIERFVIEADIVQHCDFGPEQGDRAIAFVHFRHENPTMANARAGEGCSVRNEILHHSAIHDGWVQTCIGQDPADHAGDGRFAAGPADSDGARCRVEQFGQQLGAGHACAAKLLYLCYIGNAVFNGGRCDQYLVSAFQAAAVLRENIDAEAFQPFELGGETTLIERTIRSCNLRPAVAHDIRERQHSRAANTAKEIGFVF